MGILAIIDAKARRIALHAQEQAHLAFLGQTSAELAHELKNPLAIIKSSIDVLQKKHDPDRRSEPFLFVSEEIMRLSGHINNILTFSKEKKLSLETIRIAAITNEIFISLQKNFPQLSLNNAIADSLIVKADRDAIHQIFGNLIRNTAEACDGHGVIRIYSQTNGGVLKLYFSDNGPGIPPDIAQRIFKPFVSGAKNSTGLGLAIVKRLCEANGWTIELSSNQPGDTQFTFTIPEESWEES